MSKLLAVAARELRERWLLFPAALVIGFFPIVVTSFGVSREDAPAVGLFGAVLLGAAAGVVIGSSMLPSPGRRSGGASGWPRSCSS
jgi:hypothetical protein